MTTLDMLPRVGLRERERELRIVTTDPSPTEAVKLSQVDASHGKFCSTAKQMGVSVTPSIVKKSGQKSVPAELPDPLLLSNDSIIPSLNSKWPQSP